MAQVSYSSPGNQGDNKSREEENEKKKGKGRLPFVILNPTATKAQKQQLHRREEEGEGRKMGRPEEAFETTETVTETVCVDVSSIPL